MYVLYFFIEEFCLMETHNGRPLFIFITGLDYEKTKFWCVILKSFWDDPDPDPVLLLHKTSTGKMDRSSKLRFLSFSPVMKMEGA